PEGMTLIVGGGYHGKSTLLRALERGVYDHVPEDGRERVVTVPEAVKIRAEDGRRVAGTDISNFIDRLPGGQDTRRFRTENASGSTSQAAAIVEALEVGARALLLDEDTSATNFMIRDGRMQRLVADEDEPITPFIDRTRHLVDELGVSTVAVIGGSGDYFDVADTVIAMREYVPFEVTAEAREIAGALPTERRAQGGPWAPLGQRAPVPSSIDARRGRRRVSIKVRGRDRLDFGAHTVELAAVEQLVETAQTRAVANAVVWARGAAIDGERGMADAVEALMAAVGEHGLAAVHPHGIGELAGFRRFELAAFLNRLRTLETEPGA
ncbi:MAG: P-loop domain-containing protein, partial [Gemmatimonadota bacterium]